MLNKAGVRGKRALATWDARLPIPAWQERACAGLSFPLWKMGSTAGEDSCTTYSRPQLQILLAGEPLVPLSLPAAWQRVGRRPGEVAGPWATAAATGRSQIWSPERSWQVDSGPPAAHGSAQGRRGAPGPQVGRQDPRGAAHRPLGKKEWKQCQFQSWQR